MIKQGSVPLQKRKISQVESPENQNVKHAQKEIDITSHSVIDRIQTQQQNDQEADHQREDQYSYERQTNWWNNPLAEAIKQIPLHEKTGYIDALTKCPEDIRTMEADPAVFIEFDDSNVWAAAKRLVNYWEWRVLLFGEDLAYKSLLTILSDETDKVATKRSGFDSSTSLNSTQVNNSCSIQEEFRRVFEDQRMVVLPQTDLEGNFVLLHENTSMHVGGDFGAFSLLRLILYNYTAIMKKIGTQIRMYGHNYRGPPNQVAPVTDGSTSRSGNQTQASNIKANVVAIAVTWSGKGVTSTAIPNDLVTVATNSRDLIRDAIPVRLIRVHLLFVPQKTILPSIRVIQKFATTIHSIVHTVFQRMTVIAIHISDRKADIIDHLLPYGITPDMIPPSIGGSCENASEQSFTTTLDDTHGMTFTTQKQQVLDANVFPTVLQDRECSQWQDLLTDCIEKIPAKEKTAYTSALLKCPSEIRNKEANPLAFFKFEEHNIFSAAWRLVRYWEWRVQLFGDVVAFESILDIIDKDDSFGVHGTDDDSNDSVRSAGYIRKDLCKLLNDQALILLSQKTSGGDYVFVFDKQRFSFIWDDSIDVNSILRVHMYQFTALMQRISGDIRNCSARMSTSPNTEFSNNTNSTNNIQGFVCISVINSFNRNALLLGPKLITMILEAIPARFVRLHLVFFSKTSSMTRLANVIVPTVLAAIQYLFNNAKSIMSTICLHEEEAMQKLMPFGFSSDMLPASLGGTWQYPTKPSLEISTNATLPTAFLPQWTQIPLTNTALVHNVDDGSDVVGVCKASDAPVGSPNPLSTGLHQWQQRQPQVLHQTQDLLTWKDLLVEAIERIPLHEKTGYLGAVVQCPLEVWSSEVNPSVFVEYEGGDVIAAAQRLVKYWEWRLLLFGELAYGPILKISRIDEDSTYNTTSIIDWNEFCELVEHQVLVILPQMDSDGNYVILYDKSRFLMDGGTQVHSLKALRIYLYIFTILAQSSDFGNGTKSSIKNERASSFVMLSTTQLVPESSHNLSKDICDMLLESLPVRFVRIHLLFLSYAPSWERLMENVVANAVSSLNTLLKQHVQVVPHVSSPSEMIHQLIPYGITVEMVPSSIGGMWLYPLQPTLTTRLTRDHQISSITQRATAGIPACLTNDVMSFNSRSTQHVSQAVTNFAFESTESVDAKFHPFYVSYYYARQGSGSTSDTEKCIIADHQNMYWSLRNELFSDRSLRVLNDALTGQGALSTDDISTLNTNFLCVLPSAKRMGHFLLILDQAKAQQCSIASQRRCFFYFLDHVLRLLCKSRNSTATKKKSPSQRDSTKEQLPQMTIVVFIDKIKDKIGEGAEFSDIPRNEEIEHSISFADIQNSFPIEFVKVHALLQSATLGWLAHHDCARSQVMRLLKVQDESNTLEIHTRDAAHPKRISTMISSGVFSQARILQAMMEHDMIST